MPRDVTSSHAHKIDLMLALTIFALVIFGLIMISSASVVVSYENFGVNNYYLKRQLVSLLIGMSIWILIQNINYQFWKRFARTIFYISLLLLVLVFIPGIGFGHGGANRWIHVGPIFVQPTELLKLTLILFLATWFEEKRFEVRDFKRVFLPFLGILAFIGLLVLKQPDMGTLSIISIIAFSVFFVAGANFRHLLAAFGCGIMLFGFLIKIAPYRLARLTIFLDPAKDSQGIGYHITQAMIAIGSGGLFGLGFGHSRQKYNYLPEASTDSIFAIVAEELGFFRSMIVILLFAYLAWRGYKVAKHAPDYFGKLVATGITTWFAFQAFINIAAMLSLVPLTGIPLPFISYGGSNLVFSLAAAGLLLNISKYTQGEGHYESDSYWWRNWWAYFANTIRRKATRRKARG